MVSLAPCWHVIKADLVQAIKQIFELKADAWELLNSANVTLIAKKDGAETVGDYRPISLMHSVAKLVGEILANRLAPHPDKMVSTSQSAKCTRQLEIHPTRGNPTIPQSQETPTLFLKLSRCGRRIALYANSAAEHTRLITTRCSFSGHN
jgi:hypothetical protein